LARSDGLNIALQAGHRLEAVSCWAQGYGLGWRYERDALTVDELSLLLRCALAAQRQIEAAIAVLAGLAKVYEVKRQVLRDVGRVALGAVFRERLCARDRQRVQERKPTPVRENIFASPGG
jgi:hypothetical protein